jgi:hypothetical protein
MRGRARLVFSVVTVGGICAAFVAPSASFTFYPTTSKVPRISGTPIRLTRSSRLIARGHSPVQAPGPQSLPQVTLVDFAAPANPAPPPAAAAAAVLSLTAIPAAASSAPPPAPAATPSARPASPGRATPVRASGGSSGGAWACIRSRESGGNYATNTGNGYYGAYQFLLSTWRSLGGTGLPSQAPPQVQDAMAQKLQQRSGWGQWSTHSACGV